MNSIPKEAEECWFHSCAGHYCVRHSWTEACTYPNCHERDYKGNPYYTHKKTQPESIKTQIEMKEEDIIKSIKKYLDEDDKKYFDAAISQCDKEELKRKIVSHSHYIYSSILCDGIENVINYLTNLKEQGYTKINTCYDDFEAYKYEEEDDDEFSIRIEKLIGNEIEHIKEKEEQDRKDKEEIKRLEKRLRELKSKKK